MHFCQYLQCPSQSSFTCRICSIECDKKLFDQHMNTHHQKPSSNHPINTLLRRKGVRTKTRYPRKKQRFECDLCGKYLSSMRSLQFHINLHRGDSAYICATCGETFFTPNGIKGHSCEKKRKRPARDFRTNDMRFCRFCAQHFESLDANKAHVCQFQHPDDPKLVVCRCCGKALARLAFNRHMESHSGVDWRCAVCGKQLATERALKTHMTTHSGNKPYKCRFCTDSFINKVVLERHMRFHGQQPRVFQCEFCMKQLSTETSLKSHVQRLHRSTVQCELCKVEFASRDGLRDHIAAEHEPSVCGVCGKSFALPRYLKMHEKLHYDEDGGKVVCSICTKQLTARNLKHHVYRHHVDRFEEWCGENPSY
jgi:KRAB domain-containing zinc finger protein